MRKITLQQLKQLNACDGQVKLFCKMFGDEVMPTEELATKHSALFDWQWAATRLLSPEARAEYKKVRDQAMAEYDKVYNQAMAEYDKVYNQAMAECDKVYNQARAEYKKVCAIAFAQLFNRD